MPHKNRQKDKSLCEKSMEVMVNIIKLSSFSLATLNLGEKPDSNKPTISSTPTEPFIGNKSKRTQAQASKHSNMQIYLMGQDDPGDSSFSDYIESVHKRNQNEVNTEVADGKASAYIRRFHENISRDNTLAAPAAFPLSLPPPPSWLNK